LPASASKGTSTSAIAGGANRLNPKKSAAARKTPALNRLGKLAQKGHLVEPGWCNRWNIVTRRTEPHAGSSVDAEDGLP
jgi:hypothetical protein